MKFRKLNKWDDVDGSKALVLVGQLIDEMLFDYALDTYKPSVMNTCLLVREAINTIHAIELGTIKRPNLRHILDELCENLKFDYVAKSLIQVDLNGVFSVLKNPKTTISNIETTVELLSRQMPLNIYKKKTEELLSNELDGEQDYSKIRNFTRTYITTLINLGFSTTYIAQESQQFFFYSSDRISNNQAINDFYLLFQKDKVKYKIIYRVPDYLLDFNEAAKKLGAILTKEIDNEKEIIEKYRFKSSNSIGFLIISDIEANDSYSAKRISDNVVEMLQTLIGLYHHKEAPKPIIESVVKNQETGKSKKITKSVNPMHKCKDMKTDKASVELDLFMDGFSMRENSFRKFNRCAELHALALSSESLENQVINLWIALESIVPNLDTDERKSQIEHICSSILPFLNIGYLNKILENFSKDIWNWNRSFHHRITSGVVGQNNAQKFAKILRLDCYANKRRELESEFRDFILLSERYKHIMKMLDSPEQIANTLRRHTERVEWQIRRIYRVRNLIVHDGVTPSYTELLIENLHDYLDSVMNGLMKLAARDHTINTIEQGFKLAEINYKAYLDNLKKKGLVFNESNLNKLVFQDLI